MEGGAERGGERGTGREKEKVSGTGGNILLVVGAVLCASSIASAPPLQTTHSLGRQVEWATRSGAQYNTAHKTYEETNDASPSSAFRYFHPRFKRHLLRRNIAGVCARHRHVPVEAIPAAQTIRT